ncbi:hypothetical protein [Burkholderia sp. RF4-BP95]|uniref:hypothetical protein n=1 Tax=Burkholderia sp. RF4-BP95 TaxID=1637845 RepID=UPI0012E388B2|nr:hypothetical protein [Burkholderia sp. RF4-BP95]
MTVEQHRLQADAAEAVDRDSAQAGRAAVAGLDATDAEPGDRGVDGRIVFRVMAGVADGTLKDPAIAATAGSLLMYFARETAPVLGFWFGTTRGASLRAMVPIARLTARLERIRIPQTVCRALPLLVRTTRHLACRINQLRPVPFVREFSRILQVQYGTF